MTLRILVIDVGGTHIKMLASGRRAFRKFDSGPDMTPKQMVRGVLAATADWRYERISIGYPGPVVHGKPLRDPFNLGPGWVGFNFAKALRKPVRIVNDAAMQALGSYRGGRMLFLGLGTGLGSAMIVDGVLQPMELAHLPYHHGKTYEDYVGERGLNRLGRTRWLKEVARVVRDLKAALEADYVVLGGGNAHKLGRLPPGAVLGDNRNAFRGGFRLWAKR
jgi:polyphosphate glucokinase